GLREQEGRVAVLAGLRDRLLGEREHTIPVAALPTVSVAEVVERALVLGIELDRLLEELRAHVDVLVARHPARAEREGEARALRALRLRLEQAELDALELLEATELAERALVEGGSLLVRRIGHVRALEEPDDGVGLEATRDAGGAQVQAATL